MGGRTADYATCIQDNHEPPFNEMTAERIRLLGGNEYESNGIYFAANDTTLNQITTS
jgi:hypothetical protein